MLFIVVSNQINKERKFIKMEKENHEVETFGLVKTARITGIPYHRLYHYFELNILPDGFKVPRGKRYFRLCTDRDIEFLKIFKHFRDKKNTNFPLLYKRHGSK